MLIINLNQQCLIRERPRGVAQFNTHFWELRLNPETYRKLYSQKDGRLKMMLWDVMKIYGPAMIMGPPSAIDTEIEVLD